MNEHETHIYFCIPLIFYIYQIILVQIINNFIILNDVIIIIIMIKIY